MSYYARFETECNTDNVLYKKFEKESERDAAIMNWPVNGFAVDGWEYNRAVKASRSMPTYRNNCRVELLEIKREDMEGVIK